MKILGFAIIVLTLGYVIYRMYEEDMLVYFLVEAGRVIFFMGLIGLGIYLIVR